MKYNTAGYNEQRYNINGVYYASSFSEIVAPSEVETASVLKSLSDSLSETDALSFATSIPLLDVVFSDDFMRIDVTNKALNDTVKLADWLSIRRTNTGEWFN